MTNRQQRVADYIGHIRSAIERIFHYCEDLDQSSFEGSNLIQDAVIRNLEIIGEACRNIDRHDPDFKERYPDFPLLAAYEMRNALSHGYFKIDMNIVWNTIRTDLPGLMAALDRL